VGEAEGGILKEEVKSDYFKVENRCEEQQAQGLFEVECVASSCVGPTIYSYHKKKPLTMTEKRGKSFRPPRLRNPRLSRCSKC